MSANPIHDRRDAAQGIPEQSLGQDGHDSAAPSVRTVLVCDDRSEVRDAIMTILTDLPRYQVVGEAHDGASCREQIERLRPDVLILDVSIPGGGADAAKAAKLVHPDLQIVVFSGRQDRRTQRDMIAAGADHYVVKTGRLGPLVESLDRAFHASAGRSAQQI